MKNRSVDIRTIFKLALHHKKAFIYGQLITLAAIIISIPVPLMLPVMVDEVLLHKPHYIVPAIDKLFGSGSAFYYIALVAAVVIFLRFLYYFLTVVTTKIFTKISKYVTFMIRRHLLTHLQYTSMNAYETLGSGAITANLITDIDTLDAFIMNSASKFVASVLTLLAVGIVMIAIDPILGILILFVQPLIMFISKKMSTRIGELKAKENQAIAEFQEDVGETLELFGQIKASNKEEYFFSKSIEQAKKIKETSNAFGFKSVAYEKLSYTIFLSVFELIRATGLLLVAYSDLSIGMMFAMFGYIWFIMTPVQDILSMQYSYASAKAALGRINKVLTLKHEANGREKIQTKALDISLSNLSFSYESSDKEVLKDITFDVPYGSKIALIGASGSGKTTLAQIISGFYEKKSGTLAYNNIEIENLDRHSLRAKIFLVLQMPILFNATLRFNITMGNENIDDTALIRALETAQLSEMLAGMPDGLDTIVGHHGIRLSGGQRQRLSIARMIVADPSVVIFDESTSALDVHTETKLFVALEPLLKDKTVITIAHRLSTVKNADRIYVLNEGKIVQQGTHEELEQQEGHYYEFIKEQLL
ncbi:ABC transporter ATP-binding protein [Sulfurimonas paralvinellae]|uniref:ABC transporter ATP-binding protein n=1 Tax=Sulfurimonas paralvinellae TaxID=317658 RepID=A0A7M1BCP6_9BACT|nr:ABC transporter ATP-binding protein [Sulfurimonas paralvinellae]QOP46562.1 ABC transporter ATP-binding protein [Sulfurimonas paralvinellae]